MLILLGIALAVASLLASLRYGSRGALPLIGLLCLGTVLLLGATLGLVPIMGLLAALQIERQQTYGRVMAMACTPAAGLVCLAANSGARWHPSAKSMPPPSWNSSKPWGWPLRKVARH